MMFFVRSTHPTPRKLRPFVMVGTTFTSHTRQLMEEVQWPRINSLLIMIENTSEIPSVTSSCLADTNIGEIRNALTLVPSAGRDQRWTDRPAGRSDPAGRTEEHAVVGLPTEKRFVSNYAALATCAFRWDCLGDGLWPFLRTLYSLLGSLAIIALRCMHMRYRLIRL